MTQNSTHFVLTDTSTVANQFIMELRNPSIQQDRMRFRINLERIGQILAYELSKTLDYQQAEVPTPLGSASTSLCPSPPVLLSILRAGLPLHQGVLSYFDQADNGFIGAYRQSDSDNSQGFSIQLDYESVPPLQDRPLIIIDPMLASGRTLVRVLEELANYGSPSQIHLLTAIAAPEGVRYLEETSPVPFKLWVGAIDDHLNAKSYIVPGLGDAGDLAFGKKDENH